MQAREIIRVNAAGVDGNYGSIYYGERNTQAEYGRIGADGQSATNPSDGSPGSDIRVRLSYNTDKPSIVQVGGEGVHTGANWAVTSFQALHLDCKGGDGGKGGRGQDGQQGGQGLRGRDATKYRDAEPGGTGAQGGDAGAGSNGAIGAAAGNVFVSVSEQDLDTLIGLTWNITGGKGGLSGTHGEPGDGGIGGHGGSGCTWTERHGDKVIRCSRPAGPAGAQGPPGNRPGTYLSGGASGANGSCQIRVVNNDLTEATYPDRYRLQVVSFDVRDENCDGVNEPGEHLIVENIVVRNVGGMPSPSNMNPIKVLVHGTAWLQPIDTEPVFLPPSILVGQQVNVPGTLRCLIRSEEETRPLGVPLFVLDEVSLIASFDRLQRAIPEFSGKANIEIQYPLILEPPTCLASVAKGDIVRFHWTLKNVSTKAYGIDVGRSAATHLCDPKGFFNFTYSDAENPREAVDELEVLEAGASVPIDQDFAVSNDVEDYVYGHLRLDLRLSHPDKNVQNKRVVMSHGIQMQISGKYSYDPLAQFLLIVNSHTPLYAIHQIRRFIWSSLGLRVDTFNISLHGSFKDPRTQKNVMENYVGKSIIIFGNTLPYFDIGNREPWDILDPWQISTLAKGGTNFLIASANNLQSLTGWGDMITFPLTEDTQSQGYEAKDIKGLISDIQKEDNAATLSHPVHKVSGKNAAGGAKQVKKKLPLRRYLTFKGEGSVTLIEGLPKTAKIFSTTMPHEMSDTLSDYHAYMIIRCLPFKAQVQMFWNLADQMKGAPVPHGTLYNGMTGYVPKPREEVISIDQKYCKAVGWAIESQIGIEVARFCSDSPWPHNIPGNILLDQLPLMSHFFNAAPKSTVISSEEGHEFLVGVLGTIYATVLNIGFRRFITQRVIRLGSRKAQLRSKVFQNIGKTLQTCAPSAAPALLKNVRKAAKGTKAEIKGTKGINGKRTLILVSDKRLTQLTQTNNATFTDLTTELNKVSISTEANVLTRMRTVQSEHMAKKARDEAHSKAMLDTMVNPDDISEDPMPPASPFSPAAPSGGLASIELDTNQAISSIAEMDATTTSTPPVRPQPTHDKIFELPTGPLMPSTLHADEKMIAQVTINELPAYTT